jgi:hypothetical protein
MGVGPVSEPSPRKSSPAIGREALRIGAAMEHIGIHGNLDGFPARRGERLALVTTAAKQGLLVWNRSRGKYELTNRGHRRVRGLRRSARAALRGRQGGGAVRSGVNAVVTAAGVVLVVGATFLAFNPSGSSDLAPARRADAYFSSSAPVSARAGPERGVGGSAEQVPSPGAASADASRAPPEPPSVEAAVDRAEARIPLTSPEEAGIETPSREAEIVTGAARPAAAADDPEAIRPAHKPKRAAGRRHEVAGPGYGFAPYAGAGQYRQWSAPAWFR